MRCLPTRAACLLGSKKVSTVHGKVHSMHACVQELEQQSKLLREEAGGVVGQDNLEHALQEVAKERQPSQAFSLA